MSTKLPDIKTNFSDWYNDVIFQAELADLAPVRGCIVIRPYGYAIWENIQKPLDIKFKETGHQNAAFPLLIPQSFLTKEAQHVEGFAPELAVVTHAGGEELEEPLVVRPTSETVIHAMFARWMRSWRDLPIKVNQWCSVVRWEKRTRPFLRTTEFWWQEGHTAHETEKEAQEEALQMLEIYRAFIENELAIPIIAAEKPPHERFAGADRTYTMEGLMQDGKALQMGTSHMISQSFAQAFGMQFQDRQGNLAYPYLTSWGVTTRLIGAVVMVHGDQKGLVLPPAIAPYHIVIVPIIKTGSEEKVNVAARALYDALRTQFRVIIDDAEETPGTKYYRWELRGVPLRIEVGPRDVDAGTCVLVERVEGTKTVVFHDQIVESVQKKLSEITQTMFNRAKERQRTSWHHADTIAEIAARIENDGGFYQTGWCGAITCVNALKEIKATMRCVLPEKTHTACCVCGKNSEYETIVAKAY